MPKSDAAAHTSDNRLFSDAERQLFRHTVVLMCLVALAALIGIIAWLLGWVLEVFYNLLLPLSVAGILALVLHPVVTFIEDKLRLPRMMAIFLLLLIFFMSLGALTVFLIPAILSQIIQLMGILPDSLARWHDHFSFYFPELSSFIESRLISTDQTPESAPVNPGNTIVSYLGLAAEFSFVPLFLFFALLSGERLREQASELLSVFQKRTQTKTLYFIDVFIEYITTFFQGQLIIAGAMGAMYALSFTLIGLQFGALLGFILGLLNIVPFLGTLIGLLVVLPMAYLQDNGGIQLLILAGAVFAAVQLVESWLLTPKIMADRSGLHPALVVIALFFWGTILGGIIGMVLAVPLTAFVVAIWSEIRATLITTLDNTGASG